MHYRYAFTGLGLIVALLLASCGGGRSNPGDVFPSGTTASATVTGPNSFLLFPNPQVQPDRSLQTNTTAYAQAYYAAIDPTNAKDTLAKWRAANGFDSVSASAVQEAVVFGDMRDLGYGRNMIARKNADGTIAVQVDNYLVPPAAGYGYSTLNLDAAVAQDRRWFIVSSCIEFSPGPNGGLNFAKFYAFAPDGTRLLAGNLDGRGVKAMPGICINCHGGRADPLTPASGSPTGQPLFPLVQNSASLQRGDVQGRLHELKVDTFEYSTLPGYTRADQEAKLKTINQMILSSYPIAAAAQNACAASSVCPEDAGRRPATPDEWQGGNDIYIKQAYGGNGMLNPTYVDTYVPPSWSAAGQTALYQDSVVHGCRTCHILRGTGTQSDIDFTNYTTFQGYADRIDALVMDRGNMPLAKIVYEKFWSTNMADTMATWLESLGQGYVGHDGAGALLKPGRPYADPGPDRVVLPGSTQLSAAASLYATTYTWSFTSNPGNNGVLSPPNSATPTFSATVDGTYVLQLVVGNGTMLSDPKPLTIVVNNALTPAPSAIRFADIKNKLLTGGCTSGGCHLTSSLATAAPTPVVYNSLDRNGDGLVNATDDVWLYEEVRGRINFTDYIASPLLLKPSGYHHNGGQIAGFNASSGILPGNPARANYDLFLNWILNGAPQ